MRCKSCNYPLRFEVLSINPITGEEDDLCNACFSKSLSEYSYLSDKAYQQDNYDLLDKPHKGACSESTGSGYYYELYDNF